MQFGQHEMIDRGTRPSLDTGRLRQLGPFRWDERPVLFPRRAGINPLRQQLPVLGLQLFARIGRWHHEVGIVTRDARDQFGVGSVARHEDSSVNHAVANIQPQIRLTTRRIRTMASEAVFGQERTDVFIEADVLPRRRTVGQYRRGDIQQTTRGDQRCDLHGVGSVEGRIEYLTV